MSPVFLCRTSVPKRLCLLWRQILSVFMRLCLLWDYDCVHEAIFPCQDATMSMKLCLLCCCENISVSMRLYLLWGYNYNTTITMKLCLLWESSVFMRLCLPMFMSLWGCVCVHESISPVRIVCVHRLYLLWGCLCSWGCLLWGSSCPWSYVSCEDATVSMKVCLLWGHVHKSMSPARTCLSL